MAPPTAKVPDVVSLLGKWWKHLDQTWLFDD
jgi:hypothetical protein